MNLPVQDFNAYVFSKQPGYNEATVRKAFANAVPLRTVPPGERIEGNTTTCQHLQLPLQHRHR